MKYKMPQEEVHTTTNGSDRLGYVIAWLLGMPASALFLVFLVRGH